VRSRNQTSRVAADDGDAGIQTRGVADGQSKAGVPLKIQTSSRRPLCLARPDGVWCGECGECDGCARSANQMERELGQHLASDM
jgi:hypothetical protein